MGTPAWQKKEGKDPKGGLTTCVLFNDKGEFQGMIVAEPSDAQGQRLDSGGRRSS
jgi:hypothetical protein